MRPAADDLHYRDFLTVALVVPEERGFPDNWIYIHSPDVKVGRIQNFGSWSPYMVKDGRTCLGHGVLRLRGGRALELHRRRAGGPRHQGAGAPSVWSTPPTSRPGYVVRMPKAYPVYDDVYRDNVDVIRRWFEEHAPNVHPVGRNGMHKYNNQDHSMYTAMLTVENIHGAHHDIWSVNVEEEYHEVDDSRAGNGNGRRPVGTPPSVPAPGGDRRSRRRLGRWRDAGRGPPGGDGRSERRHREDGHPGPADPRRRQVAGPDPPIPLTDGPASTSCSRRSRPSSIRSPNRWPWPRRWASPWPAAR